MSTCSVAGYRSNMMVMKMMKMVDMIIQFSGQDKDLEVRASLLWADELMPFIQMKQKQQCSTLKWRTICFNGICLPLMDSIWQSWCCKLWDAVKLKTSEKEDEDLWGGRQRPLRSYHWKCSAPEQKLKISFCFSPQKRKNKQITALRQTLRSIFEAFSQRTNRWARGTAGEPRFISTLQQRMRCLNRHI